MVRTLTVFGTRPEAIKLSPLVKKLESQARIENVVCVTAQHRQMLDQVLSLFEINPNFDLNLMKADQDLFGLTARIIAAIKDIIFEVQPDLIFVQGDTTTTLCTALGAFYAGVPVAHVEAGLRTHDLRAPFPEEANRCLTTRLASFHFCPTQLNHDNLINEGINANIIWVTGNTVIDALLWVRERIKSTSVDRWKSQLGSAYHVIESQPYVLMTGHRRENFGERMKDVCLAVKTLASRHPQWHFIYPVHMNPNVLNVVHDILSGHQNIHLIEPLDYEPFVFLLDRAKIVLTDSGGVQEEAPSMGKPVIVTREKTERSEAVEAGTVRLVGTDYERIVDNMEGLMFDPERYREMAEAVNPYGDGQACDRIVKVILDFLFSRSGMKDAKSI